MCPHTAAGGSASAGARHKVGEGRNKYTEQDMAIAAPKQPQVLSLLALIVQKYK